MRKLTNTRRGRQQESNGSRLNQRLLWLPWPRRCVSGRAVEWGCGAPRVRAGWPGCGWEWSAAAFAPPVEAAVQARRTVRLDCGLV